MIWKRGMAVRRLCLLLAGMAVVGLSSDAFAQRGEKQRGAKDMPSVKITPPRLDLGHCLPGGEASGTAEIVNTGNRPVTIIRTQTSCKCTVPTIREKMILPGESVPLEATIDIDYDFGRFAKRVSIFFDGYARPVVMNVMGVNGYDVYSEPTGVTAHADDESVTVDILSVDGSTFNITRVAGGSPLFEDGFRPGVDEPRSKYSLHIPLGSEPPTWIAVETDHPSAPLVEVELGHPVVKLRERPHLQSSLRPKERRWNLGKVHVGETQEFTVSLKGPFEPGTPFADLGIELDIAGEDPGLKLVDFKITRSEEKSSVDVVITVEMLKDGLLYEPLFFKYEGLESRIWLLGSGFPALVEG